MNKAFSCLTTSVFLCFLVQLVSHDIQSQYIDYMPEDITSSSDIGLCMASVSWSEPTAAEGFEITSSHYSGDFFPMGVTTVTYTASNEEGETELASFDVMVEDLEAPLISSMEDMYISVNPNLNGAIVTWSEPSFTDNCSLAFVDSNANSGDWFEVGTHTVTYVAHDSSGNLTEESFTVVVISEGLPEAYCQNITVELDASGNASISPEDVDGGTVLYGGEGSFTINQEWFSCADLGVNSVVLTATNSLGNASYCTAQVTVEDNTPPVAICQAIDVQLDAAGEASITASDVDAGSFDNCGINTLTVSPDIFTSPGTHDVVLTVVDSFGNESTCGGIVECSFGYNPVVAVCQDVTVYLSESGTVEIFSQDIDGGSYSTTTIVAFETSETSFSEVGTYQVELSVYDEYGNVGSCMSNVSVLDENAPDIVCQNITVQLDETGSVDISSSDIDGGTDFSGYQGTLTAGQTNFDCSSLGLNTVMLTATNSIGNTSSCLAEVTVEDNTAPVAICQDVTLELDSEGNAELSASDIDFGSYDNCGVFIEKTISMSEFTTSDIGLNTVSLTVTDMNGNMAMCYSTVTVISNEEEAETEAICQNLAVMLNENGEVTISPEDIDGGSVFNGEGTLEISQTTFDCSSLGLNAVMLTATNSIGNTSSCLAEVTVEDNTAPVAICQDVTLELDSEGNAELSASDIDFGSYDNCGVFIEKTISMSEFTTSDIGLNTVSLTVTDMNGNMAMCYSTVTVISNEEEAETEAICQNLAVMLNENGEVTISPEDIDGGSVFNGEGTLEISQTTFGCEDLGINTVLLTAADTFGNMSTCASQIAILDVTPPLFSGPETLQIEENTTVGQIIADLDQFSLTDNCSLGEISASISLDDPLEEGEYVVTFTASDLSGNLASIEVILIVEGAPGNASSGFTNVDWGFDFYPNPIDEIVNVEFDFDKGGFMTIVDMTGKTVYKQEIISQKESINLNFLTHGIYVLRVTHEDEQLSKRLMVK